MKIITVFQPWASLIAIQAKPYEFRERPYNHYINPPETGERIGIHAAQRPVRLSEVGNLLDRLDSHDPDDTPCLVEEIARPFLMRAYAWLVAEREAGLRRRRSAAVTVDTAEIAAAMGHADALRLPLGAIVCTAVIGKPMRGDDTFNWGWPMQDVEPVVPPFPCKGSQGWWQYNGALS
ncbi:hypothetical protein PQJ75_13960 [Rhodoplanes sp. TEM]|uniref:ASCH domain-containing protein n=1 Tax=Rhodoplanes tepidamans TaxID=200616 RepID=A0ABT5JEE5_RHOTP|nr:MULTISPECIES: hypothetical protein [Rhodoplanes]MDC7787997.1 hypothetical protein [Rhodoplanes tepidamans]MDC7984837.1 hypothetical protein [Rhodoplanes sp. TEM]MDQ0358426.1 hypothetical protein [Rhodoplanes tepidamans]